LSARILSGKEVAAELRSEVAARVAALGSRGKSVGLATILVGDDAASHVYVRNKHRAAEGAGMISFDCHLPAEASQAEVLAQVEELNEADEVDGYIVQLPLPAGLDPEPVLDAIDPAKDADGLHPVNLGKLVLGRPRLLPATPSGILRILDHYGIPTEGASALVVGRSFLVGRPLAIMLGLKGRDATVTLAHTRTRGLAELARKADLLVVAAGRAGLIGAEHVKPGATVIDVGTNHVGDRLVGDVDFESVVAVAGAITPVPGGVGPMTIASLLANTVAAAEARAEE